MSIVVAEVEASGQSSVSSNLKLFGHEPVASVCHNVQCINLFLVCLCIDEMIVASPLIVSHIRFEALLEVAIEEGLQAVVVV